MIRDTPMSNEVCDGYFGKHQLEAKLADTPLETSRNLVSNKRDLLQDPTRYRRLIGKLIYLTITWPDLSFAVSLVS